MSMPRQPMSRRTMLRLTAMTAAGAMAAACVPAAPAAPTGSSAESAPAAEAVEIIATTQMPVNTFDNSIARGKEKLPNIALEVNANSFGNSGWDGYADTLITRLAGGEQIDVIMIAIEGLGLLSVKNMLVPLDEFLAADAPAAEILENDVHVTLREMLQVDGKQMEYPFSWNNMVMYYNTAIFEEEGIEPPSGEWTWDNFLEVCTKVARVSGGADDRYAYSFWGSGMFGMAAWYFRACFESYC